MAKKIRLSVPLSEEIYAKIEKDAQDMGISTATYAAMIIGQHYKNLNFSMDMASEILTRMVNSNAIIQSLAESKGIDPTTLIEPSLEDSATMMKGAMIENNKDEK